MISKNAAKAACNSVCYIGILPGLGLFLQAVTPSIIGAKPTIRYET